MIWNSWNKCASAHVYTLIHCKIERSQFDTNCRTYTASVDLWKCIRCARIDERLLNEPKKNWCDKFRYATVTHKWTSVCFFVLRWCYCFCLQCVTVAHQKNNQEPEKVIIIKKKTKNNKEATSKEREKKTINCKNNSLLLLLLFFFSSHYIIYYTHGAVLVLAHNTYSTSQFTILSIYVCDCECAMCNVHWDSCRKRIFVAFHLVDYHNWTMSTQYGSLAVLKLKAIDLSKQK